MSSCRIFGKASDSKCVMAVNTEELNVIWLSLIMHLGYGIKSKRE